MRASRWLVAAGLSGLAMLVLREPAAGQSATKSADAAVRPAVCLLGFSKNLCGGELRGGLWRVQTCNRPDGVPCSTLVGVGVPLRLNVRLNDDACDLPGPATITCDETPDLRGLLAANLNIRIRLQDPCAVRGAFSGSFTWSHDTLPFVLARGRLQGTLGVGTHRPALCPDPTGAPAECGPACESCRMAEFDSRTGTWRIHVEGSLVGTVQAGPHRGCRISATIQGVIEAPGGPDGPKPPGPNGTWRFCGTADGVLECVCR